MTEADLAARLVAWLEAAGWDVYQEVECWGGLADIVAVRDRRAWLIECKLVMGFDVVAQADRHIGTAHYVSVAVPRRRSYSGARGRRLARDLLRWRGIGLLELPARDYGEPGQVVEKVAPRLQRRLAHDVRLKLRPEQKTHARAGTNRGGQWTPWQANLREIRSYVAAHPGTTLKELATELRTDYVTGPGKASNVGRWVERQDVPGVTLRRDGRRLTLWPA